MTEHGNAVYVRDLGVEAERLLPYFGNGKVGHCGKLLGSVHGLLPLVKLAVLLDDNVLFLAGKPVNDSCKTLCLVSLLLVAVGA